MFKNIIIFGAGASYGSDTNYIREKGLLPPLGKDLFLELVEDPALKNWYNLPESQRSYFQNKNFEEGMERLLNDEETNPRQLGRDQDLSIYFSKFLSRESNLYYKLAKKIATRSKKLNWDGGIITLNYDRLMEAALIKHGIFPDIKGVTYYDIPIKTHLIKDRVEICYPHGACHLFFYTDAFKGKDFVAFGPEARFLGKEGVNQFFVPEHVKMACEKEDGLAIPIICRYEPTKHPSVNNYFTDLQKKRCEELILEAKKIVIIGVHYNYENDHHVWEPLAKTTAKVTYFEPYEEQIEKIKEWAGKINKPATHLEIIPKAFKNGFDSLLELIDLR